MERFELVDKLKNKTGISYEEAEAALRNSNWDILDAMLYLENRGRIEKPSIGIFYTNDDKEYEEAEEHVPYAVQVKQERSKRDNNSFEGIFEAICKVIDTGNNIFLEVSRKNKTFFKIPITVLILLFIFTFWFLIPLIIVGLIFDMRFSVTAKTVNTDRINKMLNSISDNISKVKEKIKKGAQNND